MKVGKDSLIGMIRVDKDQVQGSCDRSGLRRLHRSASNPTHSRPLVTDGMSSDSLRE